MFTRSTAGPRASAADRPATFSSLRTRNFRIFLSGQLISNVGGWAQRIAQDWLVLTLTKSPTAVGVIVALQLLPSILFGPVGGLVADRFPKRTVLVCTQIVMGSCAGVLAVLTLTGTVEVWHIFAVAVVLGIAIAIDNPTRQAFVNEMVGPRLLRNAISLNSAAFQLGALVGPAVAGALISTIGIGAAFALNAMSFTVVLVALLRIRSSELQVTGAAVTAATTDDQPVSTAVELFGRPEMRWPTVLVAVFSIFTVSFPVTMAAFANGVFEVGAGGFALLTCALAVGSLIGSLSAARRVELRLRGLVGLAAGLAATQLVAAAAPGMAAFAVSLVAVGFCSVVFGVSANAGVQLAARDHNRGRIMGLYLLVVVGAGCVGGPLVGAINENLGPRYALLFGAIVPGLVTLVVGLRLARTAGIEVVPTLRRRFVVGSQQVRSRVVHPLGR
ncbi:MFS transporter [Nakamurella lactea]|uniref:MFS transporter n=1 Tax=Nakamurella lactea TaxID=459515 RepID=UPI00041B8756|nr:MFS transporter [Nakamurella lactea]